MNVFVGQEQRHRHRGWTCGHGGRGRGGWDGLGEEHRHVPTSTCQTDR